MSNYQKGDIVEFFNGNNQCEFGVIISVQISDTISALVVSGFAPNNPQWISTDRVINHWKNIKGYISDLDIVQEENAELRYIVEQFSKWTAEGGCVKANHPDFPCWWECNRVELELDDYCDSDDEIEHKCWVEYYRWKYRQKLNSAATVEKLKEVDE